MSPQTISLLQKIQEKGREKKADVLGESDEVGAAGDEELNESRQRVERKKKRRRDRFGDMFRI